MRLLFVCHGNICRSPMAEFVMKDLLDKAGIGGVEVESAALHTDEIGSDVHRGTHAKLRAEGVPFSPRAAWLLTREKARAYDMIVGMDRPNMADLARLVAPGDRGRLRMMLDFAGRPGEEVADPWYTGDFDATYRDVLAGCKGLLIELERRAAAQPGGVA